jgi:hypothetical protein
MRHMLLLLLLAVPQLVLTLRYSPAAAQQKDEWARPSPAVRK